VNSFETRHKIILRYLNFCLSWLCDVSYHVSHDYVCESCRCLFSRKKSHLSDHSIYIRVIRISPVWLHSLSVGLMKEHALNEHSGD